MATIAPTQPDLAAALAETQPRNIRPILWWAALGAAFFAFAAYLVISWVAAGEPHRVQPGPTPLPVAMRIALTIQQWGLFGGMLALIWFKTIRPRLRTGSFTFDGMMVLSFAILWWSDPLYNYFTPGFNYNAYFFNLGSWIGHVPGWMSPNPTEIPQPLLWLPGVYTCAFFLMALATGTIMRKTRERYPRFSGATLWFVAFLPMVVLGTLWEALFMVMGSHHYGSSIRAVTLNAGHYYGFPVYQGITASLLYTTWGALRFFRDDRGQSFAERGLERLRFARSSTEWIRLFAVSGAITAIFFAFYHVPNAMLAERGAAWPQDVQKRSYFTTGVCGPGTDVACPDPRVPFPRGKSSWRIAPDGSVVVPDGSKPLDAPEQSRAR